MSQRHEKYARTMERRVASLEDRLGRIYDGITGHEVRLTTAEELLEVMAMPTWVIKAAPDRDKLDALSYAMRGMPPGTVVPDYTIPTPPPGRRASNAEIRAARAAENARRKQVIRRRVAALWLAVLAVVLLVIVVARASAETGAPQESVATVEPEAAMDVLTAAELDVWNSVGEDQLEAEKIEEALLAQGYFSLAVPMPFEYQDYMRTYCAAYGCPYPLALAVAEVESHFDMDAVGAAGEVGIMQLNPGPGGSYHAEIQAATGLDPTTPSGNIAGGCYKLGQYMAEFQDAGKAAMAYNMGRAGAMEVWAAGITSTDYSDAVLAAMEDWECTVNAWNGQ